MIQSPLIVCHALQNTEVANFVKGTVQAMNLPFQFKTVAEWESVLQSNGLRAVKTIIAGFEPKRMHKSCHV